MSEPLILVHGGAGDVPAASRARHREGCLTAARAGGRVLADGGSAIEAACAAVVVLEDDDIYNAGTGCALSRDGGVSLDAAVMCGATAAAGAVAALPAFKNPVRIAQRLLDEPVVLLAGLEASRWAEAHGFEPALEDELIVERSYRAYEHVVRHGGSSNWAGGTVGAVARDAQGRLAAATSTGGTMGKLPGRVGDSPILGAGTFATERCAVSATGDGEAFLRSVFAARVVDAVLAGADPRQAMERSLADVRDRFAGLGGAILITTEGGPFASHTTRGMSHAWWSPSDEGLAD